MSDLLELKKQLCVERDMCIELSNFWSEKAYELQHNQESYSYYMGLIRTLEHHISKHLYPKIVEINKILAKD